MKISKKSAYLGMFTAILCLAGLCGSVVPAHAVIIIDNPGTGVPHDGTGSLTTLALPGFTVGTGDNRMLVVTAGGEVGGGDITSVTYGSQSFTRGAFVRETGVNNQFAEVWWLANPASGSNTITATIDVPDAGWAIGAMSLENVVQTGPVDFDTFGSTANVTGGSISLDVSGLNPFVIEALGTNQGIVATPGAGQNPFYSVSNALGGGYAHLGAYDSIFSGSPTTQSWTLSSSQRLAIAGVVFNQVAPVPEPSSFLLLGLGALGLVRHARRRRRRA